MLPLPPDMVSLLLAFAPLFSSLVFPYVPILVVGAILAPGKRTVNCQRNLGVVTGRTRRTTGWPARRFGARPQFRFGRCGLVDNRSAGKPKPPILKISSLHHCGS